VFNKSVCLCGASEELTPINALFEEGTGKVVDGFIHGTYAQVPSAAYS